MWNIKFSIIHIHKSEKKFSYLKYELSVHLTWKYGHKIFCRKCGIFFILELWKSGCRFFNRKYKNVYFTYPNMVTWNMEFFSYFPFENICEFFPSWNSEYCLFNIWKTCVNFPTRNIELSHRFSCLNSEILYIFIKNVWKVFCYEIWNSVYFPFDNLGRNVLIWNMNSQFFTCETLSRFVYMKENFPWFRN